MKESLRARFVRLGFNLFPCYFASGARISYLADDWGEIRIELPLSLRSRNYGGTIFGGSMYAAVDPIYMLMLIKGLGPGYVVWDKAAAIRFRRPGRTTLHARFVLPPGELASIREALLTEPSLDRVYSVDLADAQGTVHATVEKTIYIARRAADGVE